jgi:hypothetical protein
MLLCRLGSHLVLRFSSCLLALHRPDSSVCCDMCMLHVQARRQHQQAVAARQAAPAPAAAARRPCWNAQQRQHQLKAQWHRAGGRPQQLQLQLRLLQVVPALGMVPLWQRILLVPRPVLM